MEYIHKLREYRKQQKYTQKAIAEMLSITQQQYQLYESGKREMPVSLYLKLARLYNIKIDELIIDKWDKK